MKYPTKICISGIGLITNLGQRVDENWRFLSAGLKDNDFRIKNFKASEYIKRRYLRPLDSVTTHCIAMAAEAMKDSMVDVNKLDFKRVGLVIGSVFSGIGCIFDFKQACYEARDNEYMGLSPLYFPGIVFNSLSGQPAIEFGFTGPNAVVNSGMSSGLLAVLKGAEYILTGKADVIIAGGAEMRHPFIDRKYELQNNSTCMGLLGPDFKLSEAACLFVLHREDDPRFSDAKRYATIQSWQYGFFPHGYSAQQLKNSMNLLFDKKPTDVSAVVTDTYADSKLNQYEIEAIDDLFADSKPTLLNNKNAFGHTLGGSGSLNLFHGLLHSQEQYRAQNKVLVNSLDPEGNHAFLSFSKVNNHD